MFHLTFKRLPGDIGDKQVGDLYDLTPEEIKIVESASAGKLRRDESASIQTSAVAEAMADKSARQGEAGK